MCNGEVHALRKNGLGFASVVYKYSDHVFNNKDFMLILTPTT